MELLHQEMNYGHKVGPKYSTPEEVLLKQQNYSTFRISVSIHPPFLGECLQLYGIDKKG